MQAAADPVDQSENATENVRLTRRRQALRPHLGLLPLLSRLTPVTEFQRKPHRSIGLQAVLRNVVVSALASAMAVRLPPEVTRAGPSLTRREALLVHMCRPLPHSKRTSTSHFEGNR